MSPIARTHEPSVSNLSSPLLVVLLFIPVFFQLDGRLFTDFGSLSEPRGAFTNLPIPLSVPACAVALLMLPRSWVRHGYSLLLLGTIPLMFLTAFVAGDGSISWAKVKLLLFQFSVPLGGFLIGRELGTRAELQERTARALLGMTALVVVAQLGSTWLRQGSLALSSDIFGLAVYGHFQYVPVILVVAYLAALFAALDASQGRPDGPGLVVAFAPVMGVYVGASMSMSATLGLWMGLALAAVVAERTRRVVVALAVLGTIAVSSAYIIAGTRWSPAFQAKYLGLEQEPGARSPESEQTQTLPAVDPGKSTRLLPNVSERLIYWDFYLVESTSSLHAFLFGHPEQPDIRKYPSAHNYYLDFLYNFGFIPLVPLLVVMAGTVQAVWRRRSELRQAPQLVGLVFLTALLLLADNGLKVGMRQLYPGISTFFLWGLLNARLERMGNVNAEARPVRVVRAAENETAEVSAAP